MSVSAQPRPPFQRPDWRKAGLAALAAAINIALIAALSGSREELIGEAADTLFHLLVLLDAKGVALDEVMAELDRREGTSGIAEKAARGQ